MNVEVRYMNLAEVGEVLHLSRNTLIRLIRVGDLPAIRIGTRGDYRVSESDLESFIRRNRA